jgi:regulator of cell morphogenesis and NO signaling
MIIKPNDTLAAIVSRNIYAANILNEHGIDYFSRGNRNLETACLEDNGPMSTILEELWDLKCQDTSALDFQKMSLTELSIYILQTHHRFTEKKVTFIKHTLARLVRENGNADEKIERLQNTFHDLSVYLTVHMRHEELVVFPFIQELAKSKCVIHSISSKILQPIASMQEDHCHEVDTLRQLSFLTKNYSASKNADYALQITYDAMRELEQDLKIHMHLENNVLFPGALYLAYSRSNN